MDRERTRRASFDPKSGEVHGSGSGAGGGGNPDEDYDSDPMGGGGAEPQGGPRPAGAKGHPLPASDEARHGEIPERLEREKGVGDDDPAVVQPGTDPVKPDGKPYRYTPGSRAGKA